MAPSYVADAIRAAAPWCKPEGNVIPMASA
jgi:hypothetical protein